MRSSVSQAYSLSSLRKLEPLVDQCNKLFFEKMTSHGGTPIDLGEWLQWYAFDVIGNITFLQTFGFMKHGEDKLNIIDGLEAGIQYSSVIGQLPELHPWLLGNGKIVDALSKIPAIERRNPVNRILQVLSSRRLIMSGI
jgi:hypothetical protein